MKAKILVFSLVANIVSCAGPHTPFGALETFPTLFDRDAMLGTASRAPASISDSVAITTIPDYQMYHRSYPLTVKIHDPAGIPKLYETGVIYNGKLMNHWWQNKTVFLLDPFTLVISYHNFRLSAHHDNSIEIYYHRFDNNSFKVTSFNGPQCDISVKELLQNLADFDVSAYLQESIVRVARNNNKNPALVAGLIAQESGFNPYAISWAKALGLTQITPLAADHVKLDNEDWPEFPKVENISYPKLKYLIMKKKINEYNDWRLNPRYSIIGGVRYLNYLENYWLNKQNFNLLVALWGKNIPWTDILLASYNSGPYRVKKNIQKMGNDWITGKSLNAAKHYVAQVKSYCYDFSQARREL